MLHKEESRESYLFILPWSLDSLGGVNQVVENLYYQMKSDNKYNPIIMVNSWSDIKIRKQSIVGIDHYFFRTRSPWNSSRKTYNFIMFMGQFLRTAFYFYDFIVKNNIGVVNVHYCSLSAFNIMIFKALGIFKGYFILSFHGGDLSAAKETQGIEKVLWKILLRSADKIITCSQSLKEKLINFDNKAIINSSHIYNGVDISRIIEERDLSIDLESISNEFIINVATLDYNKGQDVLLKAFDKISKDYPNINLVLIGRPGGAELQIKQLIASLDLTKRVHLYEGLPHEQILTYIQKSKIFVLPSRYEAFGIVILEAGAFGTPVIASNVGGIREILSHDETGRLCEPDDISCLAKEMGFLLTDSAERKRLGENLQKHIRENFSWKRTYQSYLDAVGM